MMRIITAFLRSLLRALGFLTRLPVNKKYYEFDGDRSSDAGLYPLAGCLIGCGGAMILIACCWMGFSPLVASLLATACLIIITGGLHEDGLSDVADAFFAPKAHDAPARLAIMKDSHIGVFGMLALIMVVLLRVVLLADLVSEHAITVAAAGLVIAEAVSRAGMVALWPSLPNVSTYSIARTIGAPNVYDALKAVLIGFFILLALSFYLANFILPLVVCLFLWGSLLLFRMLCRHKIGGLCGDVLGAAQQIGVIIILLICVLVFK